MNEQPHYTKIYIALSLLLLLAVGFVVYETYRALPHPTASPTPTTFPSPNPTPNPTPSPAPATSTPPVTPAMRNIKTTKGDFISVHDFYKGAFINGDKTSVVFRDTPEYYISFYVPGQSFVISLLNPDVQKARQDAEREFLVALGVTTEQVCQFNISLGVATWANELFADKNYGLSFCPNGLPFINP